MKNTDLLRTRRRLKCKAWAQERVDGNYGYRDSRELRTELIKNLTTNLAKDFNLDVDSVKERLEAHIPSFEFKYQYPDIEVDVANVLLSYLSGSDPFKQNPGKRAVNQQENHAALFAWIVTDNLSATAQLFGKDISSFKRDMGTFAENIGVRLPLSEEEKDAGPYQKKMAYFKELRNVGGNIATMEASKQCFIDYMKNNHLQQWDKWIKSNQKN
ncbi:hypothetical protein BCU83_10765 [Vibrio breoganii]|uniref:hypothetical protein n=1 Tax=Vibrio breoganii TaxID=553239 RepID=UPI000C83CA2B|nr:hypothetical protein [Vibrio breoganii]PMG80511.1 hypothetical protein BCU83_10765 [Vibrio breoganii]